VAQAALIFGALARATSGELILALVDGVGMVEASTDHHSRDACSRVPSAASRKASSARKRPRAEPVTGRPWSSNRSKAAENHHIAHADDIGERG